MKKLFIIILSLCMALGMASGCFQNQDSDTENSEYSSLSGSLEGETSEDSSSSGGIEGETSEDNSSSNSEEEDSKNDSEDSSNDDSSTSNSSNVEIVPPITDGGNFDGTV